MISNEAGSDTLYKVVFDLPEGVTTIAVRGNEFILDAARRQGIVLPSMCERGWCTTCAVKVLSGNIDQSASLRYFEEDRSGGFALICTGRPRSDLRLRPRAREEMAMHRQAHHLPYPGSTRGRNAPEPPKQPSS